MYTYGIYLCILNICNTTLAYVVTIADNDAQPAALEFEENDKMVKYYNDNMMS